jgi:hypothetical protein
MSLVAVFKSLSALRQSWRCLVAPLNFLSIFHTAMWISHYNWFSIYIVIVCKYTGIYNVNSNELTTDDQRYKLFFSIILRQIDKKT